MVAVVSPLPYVGALANDSVEFSVVLLFPGNNKTTLNSTLSLASAPTYGSGDTTATIAMKPNYKWSNGESVTTTDVAFFLNMMHAETANWFDYVPGYIPDNIKGVSVSSPTSMTVT